ncbi:hypothetical protein AB0I00_30315 [Streptomyces sp. NPDC050803]|uniref:hypothetical protein n=1 Tax=unclassified Streptomyces TaxID=2593676 RepID=UPI003421D9A8
MNEEFKQLVSQVSDPLKRDHGFSGKGRTVIREDHLLRAVAFHPEKTAARGKYRFDVTLSLGLPGLSSVAAARREWVVSASLGKLYRLRYPGKGRFELAGDESDIEVERAVTSLLSDVCSEFLLSVPGPEELLELLRDKGEFKRLDLWPWNELPRLELASVYCAYLGREEQANQLMEEAIQCALDGGMDYAVGRVRANVEHALTARRASGGTQ